MLVFLVVLTKKRPSYTECRCSLPVFSLPHRNQQHALMARVWWKRSWGVISAEVKLPCELGQDSLKEKCNYDEQGKRPCCESVSQTCPTISYCDVFVVLCFSLMSSQGYYSLTGYRNTDAFQQAEQKMWFISNRTWFFSCIASLFPHDFDPGNTGVVSWGWSSDTGWRCVHQKCQSDALILGLRRGRLPFLVSATALLWGCDGWMYTANPSVLNRSWCKETFSMCVSRHGKWALGCVIYNTTAFAFALQWTTVSQHCRQRVLETTRGTLKVRWRTCWR